MQIVKFSDFLKLPAGTVYSNYAPDCTRGLNVKETSSDDDFFYREILPSDAKTEVGARCRDGSRHHDALFVVFDDKEISVMGSILYEARRKLFVSSFKVPD